MSLMDDEFGHHDLDMEHDLHHDPMDELDRFEIFMPAVQSLVNAVGGYEEVPTPEGGFETIYRPGDSVVAVLKDLKKLWRKDDSDDERTVARCMARAGLMKELIALLVECTDRGEWGRKVALVACDLIAALTWPIDVMQELKEMEDEPDVVTDYVTLLRAQVEYKAMLLQTTGPLRCILALLLPSLAKPRKDEKDEKIISLGLHIVRNLLAIRDTVAEGTAVGEKEEFSNLQSSLIIQLGKLTYFQLILTLASCANKSEFNQYNVLVLDILHLTFQSVRPRDLIKDQEQASKDELSRLLEAEKKQKALHARTAMSRHSRFGTTVAVRAGDQKIILHKQNAIRANPGRILDEVKRKRAGRMKKVDELSRVVPLVPEAMKVLQGLSKTFIQSCFNTFFESIIKDIRMERSKVRPADNIRCFFLSRFFLEYFLLLRGQCAAKNGNKVPAEEGLELGLVGELAELESVRWIVMRMRYSMEDKPPAWKELQASMECFTQILLLIESLASSDDEDDIEAASTLQEKLYYNGDILDSCLLVISQYKDQSVGYLDSVIHFAYVLLRMLERYSKSKSYMFIRKRKAAKKKRKAEEENGSAPLPEEYGEDEEAGILDGDDDTPSYAEHAFTFQAFEKRFASESVVHTLVSYLGRFQEFDDTEQIKRVVGLMHRQVVKTQAEGLYFKVSCLILFQKILDGQHALPRGEPTKDLLHLVNFILRKFFKRVQDDPFVIVQALGPKTRGHWKELSSYKSDEDSDDDGMAGQKARIQEKMARAPAELEFKKNKNLSWSEQMGTVIAMLLSAEHREWIEWIIEVLEVALAARQEIVLATDGQEDLLADESEDEDGRARNFAGPSKEAREKFEQFNLDANDNEERRNAMAKDAHFRLMLKLLSFERTDEDKALDQKWFIPATVLPSDLSTSLGALRQYLLNPPTVDDPKSLLRKARPPRPPRRRKVTGSGSDSEEEDRPRVQRKKKAQEMQFFKSAAFIDDSDDDEDADRAFFEREKRLREEMRVMAEQNGHVMASTGTKKRKREKKGKGGEKGKAIRPGPADVEGDEDQEMRLDVSDEEGSDAGRKRASTGGIESESEIEGLESGDEESGRKGFKSKSVIGSESE